MNSTDSKINQAVQRQMMQAKVEEAILGSLKQVGVVGISFGLEVKHPEAISELPETIVISKFSAMGNKVFYHLAITSQAKNIGGTAHVLHELVNALESQAGQEEGPEEVQEVTDLSPASEPTGTPSSNEGQGQGQETTPSPDLSDT